METLLDLIRAVAVDNRCPLDPDNDDITSEAGDLRLHRHEAVQVLTSLIDHPEWLRQLNVSAKALNPALLPHYSWEV